MPHRRKVLERYSEPRSRRATAPSMSTRAEREASVNRPIGEKRLRLRDTRAERELEYNREGRSRRGIAGSMSTRAEREYSAGRAGGTKRRYKRDRKGRFA